MTVKVDCNVGTWGPWEERSVTCGGGIRMRCRDVTQETKHVGVPCPNPNYTGWYETGVGQYMYFHIQQ